MRQGAQADSPEDESEPNSGTGYRAADAASKSAACPGRQPDMDRCNSAASSIRRAQSRLQRQDTALSVHWGRISDVDYEVSLKSCTSISNDPDMLEF
jgi:hypothetical protein